VAREKLLKVTIPPGVEDGNQLRLTGEGEGGLAGGPAGDLYVLLHVRPHEIFVRQGADLVCALPLTYPQVCLGDEVDVPVLDGKARLHVPPGTQPGQRLLIKGKGMPHLRGRGRGNAIYEVVVEVPARLSARERQLLEELREVSKESSGPLLASFLERMKKLFGG
jgi:molecular chaperone DnaJ